MRQAMIFGLVILAGLTLSACVAGKYKSANCDEFGSPIAKQTCQGYQRNEVDIAIQQEKAALLKNYRICLEKYEAEPTKAKEHCAIYTQALHEVEVKFQR